MNDDTPDSNAEILSALRDIRRGLQSVSHHYDELDTVLNGSLGDAVQLIVDHGVDAVRNAVDPEKFDGFVKFLATFASVRHREIQLRRALDDIEDLIVR